MLLLYYTHSILFYLGLTNNDLAKSLQANDFEYLPREVCVAQCLEKRNTEVSLITNNGSEYTKKVVFQTCLDTCELENGAPQREKDDNSTPSIKQIHENYILNLVCRSDSSLNFRIDLYTTENKGEQIISDNNTAALHDLKAVKLNNTSSSSSSAITVENPGRGGTNATGKAYGSTIFLIKIHLAKNADKYFAYLSDDNFFTIDSLLANTTYNISVLAVQSNYKYSIIAQQQQFTTLRRGYTPGNITEIKVTDFTADKWNKMFLTATLTWKPAADFTCHYDVIWFSPESADYEFQPLEIRDPRQLYKYKMENLTFSSVYKVGIRAINTRNMRESDLYWQTFIAPSCVDWHNYNFNICAPVAPQELQIDQMFEDKNTYTLNISWSLPTHLPDNYTLRIKDISQNGETKVYNLKKDVHNILIPHIHLNGLFYEVSLTASTPGGNATTSYTDVTKTIIHIPEKNPFVKLIASILAPILCVAILSLTLYIIYHRRIKLKRYRKERSKYFEELEKKTPLDSKETFSLTTNIKQTSYACQVDLDDITLFNDDMEIDRKHLSLYEVLGEGAFGLVKRGVYKDNKENNEQEVAVKMLKDHPSPDEIRAFGLEIEVMKSVKKHPNIVGIIGHCTRLNSEMMLLTEYCSFGNLLNFLRDEWRFLHELQRKKQILTKNFVDIELPIITESYNKSKENPINKRNFQSTTVSPDHKQIIGEINSEPSYGLTALDSLKSIIDNHDPTNENYITNKFKKKLISTTLDYNGLKFFIYNNNINNNNNNKTNLKNSQYIENFNTSIKNVEKNSTLSGLMSPAAENKSYGYQSCCTNSGKSDVAVILGNANSSTLDSDNEALNCLLVEQQNNDSHLEATQCSTIEVSNCDCKSQQHSTRNGNSFNSAVENMAYFKTYSPNKPKKNVKDSFANATTTFTTTTKFKNSTAPNNVGSRAPLTGGDLLDIARQVAVGMEFLAKSKVVHRDLAARNILVTSDRTIKISDFGLSRDVYQENMYKKTGNGKLPIKWLALESMTHQVYTTQSDVWSYGILLYEIITLGATPYPSISTNRLLEMLKSGYRMEKPKNCGPEFYNLMRSCWNAVPNERPTFGEITEKIDDMLKNFNTQTNDNAFRTKTIMAVNDNMDKLKELHYLSHQESSAQQHLSEDAYLTPLQP